MLAHASNIDVALHAMRHRHVAHHRDRMHMLRGAQSVHVIPFLSLPSPSLPPSRAVSPVPPYPISVP